ncbi:hypothetical protein BH09BAC4_BH09BAC4_23410 [soil metagenome]
MTTRKPMYTLAGLSIAYLSIAGISLLFRLAYGKPLNDLHTIAREGLIFLMAAALILIIRLEKLHLTSVGLYPKQIGRSLIWGLCTVILCFGLLFVCLFIFKQMGWVFGESKSAGKLSLWTLSLVVLRAGVVEELFFRGYIIERLKVILKNSYVAAFSSLIPFALFHYSQGITGIILAFVMGGVLTGMYMWRKDLKSIMIAHFFIDFVPNVLGAL